ncbi:serine/threonine-protein kinase [Embleya sp. NBC_00896]|uniref:serine/threonine-protein kinase n=1 Tax=Embleya sp. NBC_00896 TaxID=2975961 RepID=UPI00386F88B9|nr:serine/threonine protein kinase [Embleya sp. NBC_00896]
MARIGPYEVVERLGAGGMGEVFLGVGPSGRRVAIKVIRAEHLDDPGFRARFRREVEMARKVGGAFTAPVVNADPDAPQPWFATVYIPAPSLDAVVRARGPLDPRAVLRLAAGLIEALQDIHAAGLIHRDLKPANILITEHDGPKVIDFGIARDTGRSLLVSTGGTFGTPAYMAPEQIETGTAGYSSDVFAMGSVLTFAATGRLAFPAETPIAVMGRILYGEADPTGIPPELADLIRACLAKPPEVRPPLTALAELVTDRLAPTPGRPPQAPEPRHDPDAEPMFTTKAGTTSTGTTSAGVTSTDTTGAGTTSTDTTTSNRPPTPHTAGGSDDGAPAPRPRRPHTRRRVLPFVAATALVAMGVTALIRYSLFSDDGPSTRGSSSHSPEPVTTPPSTPPSMPPSTPPTADIPGGKAAPNGGTWCTPSMIRVQIQPVESGKAAYNASQNVALKVLVTNQTGPTCYVDLAPSRAYIEVRSGSERLWISADCAAGAATDVRQLQQGDAQAVSITRDWSWTRSNAAQCATNGGQSKAAPADKAVYRAKAILAGLESSGEFLFTAVNP